MMDLRYINDLKDLRDKIVLCRLDWNVSEKEAGELRSTRIPPSFKTLRYLQSFGAKIVVLVHRGDPTGWDPHHSFMDLISSISELYGSKISFCADDLLRDKIKIKERVDQMSSGDILVLENLRFYAGERDDDEGFALLLASIGDVYVNDAFGVVHRKNASVHALARLLPSYAGFLIYEEVHSLERVITPVRSAALIIGGAKIADKIGVIEALLKTYDSLYCGSVLAKLFFLISGRRSGVVDIPISTEALDRVAKVFHDYKDKIVLPIDAVCSTDMDPHARVMVKSVQDIESEDMFLDIGPKSIILYSGLLRRAKTILWNGPLGLYEIPAFRHGTRALAMYLGTRGKKDTYVAVGGGETIDAIIKAGVEDSLDFVSTGGGAMLAYLLDQNQPGLTLLKK